ncbi:hypothetical protein BLOT_013706 [Blomia tropicalis]|nr:hypothetical protein BLOT_013706 [Blomia tropicalis]
MSYVKNASGSGSTKLTFPCTECNFEAQSARQLSRHKAVTHTQNALKCVLCPFVTAYQTNLLRHRKDVHGICGSKGNKSCKFCGFVSEDNDTLIHHQIEFHQDILKSAQVKFAKELVSAGGDESIADFSANFESMSEELFNGRQGSFQLNLPKKDSLNTSRSSTPKSHSSHNNKDSSLPATRIRRQYTCNECGFRTVNPREFLYHRRDGHGHRIKIVECPYCVYACQYVQKLQRHLLLVHKLQSLVTPSGEAITNGADLEGILMKPKFKKFKHSEFDGSSILDNDAMSNNESDLKYEEEDNQSLNDEDFEHMNNFEMNLNEYEDDDDEGDGGEHQEQMNDDKDESMDKDEMKYPINLECYICKIKFADIISAQKHYVKNHKYNDSTITVNSNGGNKSQYFNTSSKSSSDILSPVQSTTSQRKVFDNAKNMHSCSYCGYKTRWISELERHVRVHSTEKPFKCMYCDFKSKWKGDLNRHIQRYHSNEPNAISNMDGIESDASANASYTGNHHMGSDDMSPPTSVHHMNDKDNDDYHQNFECSLEMGEDQAIQSSHNGSNDNHYEMNDTEDSNPMNMSIQNGNTAKMYKCTYCDFMCSTASRFHVHYVQHLNTKPFQCSICGHRSNWEWDVTKHIKMKAQRDPNHEKARPVLIHDSGKRDYSKYNKFVVWVGQAEAEMANHEASKIDFRAKRFRTEVEEPEPVDEAPMENILMPEVCFEVDDEDHDDGGGGGGSSAMQSKNSSISSSTQQTLKSVIVSRHANSRNRTIFCNECNFKHQFARVVIAHMSNHFGSKTYGCQQCPFESNWHEVIISHIESEHMGEQVDFEIRFHCKMTIHCRFHNPSKGSLKCQNCPYYVNSKEKLIRHQKLHQKIGMISGHNNGTSFQSDNFSKLNTNQFHHQNIGINGNFNKSNQQGISCPICSFRAMNSQLLIEHMKVHDTANMEFEDQSNRDGASGDNDNVGGGYGTMLNTGEYNNGSVSLIDINNMKNGTGKKFSYVCPECPAAFKSPGDYKIHAVFHTSNYQHACPYCSYKARNKPQLCKHLYVHTAEYIAKRANSYPDGTKHLVGTKKEDVNHLANSYQQSTSANMKQQQQVKKLTNAKMIKQGRKHRTKIDFPMKPVKVKLNSEENGKQKIVFNNTDLMASQEFLETKEYLQRINSGIKNRCMYRCSTCPAVFTKVNTLIYHMTLHDQKSQFTCDSCTYSTTTEDNLSIHSLLHNLTESQAALGYNFNYNCHRCPAGFSKRTRLEKHLSLHGAKYNWKCDKCDYSVRYAATLVKHRALHLINPNFHVLDNNSSMIDQVEVADVECENGIGNTATSSGKLKMTLNIAELNNIQSDDGAVDVSNGDDDNDQQTGTFELNADDDVDISQDNSDEDEIQIPGLAVVEDDDDDGMYDECIPEAEVMFEEEIECGEVEDDDEEEMVEDSENVMLENDEENEEENDDVVEEDEPMNEDDVAIQDELPIETN